MWSKRLALMCVSMSAFFVFACSGGMSPDDSLSGNEGVETVTLVINNPAVASASASVAAPPDKLASGVSFTACALSASGPAEASATVLVPSDSAQMEVTFDIPIGSGYTLCAECLDSEKTSNGVGAGIRGCASDVTVPADDEITIGSLFFNQAARVSGDARYCRVRQDSSTEVKLLCGFDGALTSAQKLTARCNLEIDTTLEGTEPTTVDATQSDGLVSGTKGRPYFVMGPGTEGLIAPACFEYDTSGTKLLRGAGSWGTDEDGNTTVECTIGVRQMEAIAMERNARFAAVCAKDGASWIAIPAEGLAEFNTNAGGDEDIAGLSANSGACSSNRACASGYCSTNSVCITAGGIGKIIYSSRRALDGSDAANANNKFNIWAINDDGTGATPLTMLTTASSIVPGWSSDGSQVAYASQRALDGTDTANTNNTWNIWIMNADGTGSLPLTSLTASGANSAEFQWSPNGGQIVYESQRALDGGNSGGIYNIWVMNADGTGSTPLTNLTATGADSREPRWSPDGAKIAYASSRALDGSNSAIADGSSNVWIMNADGNASTPLTRLTTTANPPTSNTSGIQWSPDGTKLAYHSRRALDGSDALGILNTWVVSVDGSADTPLTRLTTAGATNNDPIWSPDGDKIVYAARAALDGSDAANENNTQNIWVVDADGSGAAPLTTLTAANVTNSFPYWSPDGGKIVYISARALDGTNASNTNSTSNLWIMNADGSGDVPFSGLTAANAGAHRALWSP